MHSHYVPSRLRRPDRRTREIERATIYRNVPAYIPSPPITAHIHHLHDDLGLPLASIARDSGVSLPAVKRIAHGTYPRISTRHAVAIKQVTHHPNPRQGTVIAVGAVRRLQGLRVLGWSCDAIAEHIQQVTQRPITAATVMGLTYRPPKLMPWDLWHAIYQVYEALSGTPGPSARARRAAAPNRWPAPLDWEDLDIDDPRVTPEAAEAAWAEQRAQTKAERIAEVARLTDAGLSSREIGERLGVTQRQVVRDRREAQTSPPYSGKDFASGDDEIAC